MRDIIKELQEMQKAFLNRNQLNRKIAANGHLNRQRMNRLFMNNFIIAYLIRIETNVIMLIGKEEYLEHRHSVDLRLVEFAEKHGDEFNAQFVKRPLIKRKIPGR